MLVLLYTFFRLSSGELYNPARKTWCDLPDMNEKRSDACATALDGKVKFHYAISFLFRLNFDFYHPPEE